MPRVLVVAIEAVVRDALDRYLRQDGMQVTAIDAGNAPAALRDGAFDVLVCDAAALDSGGAEGLRAILAGRAHEHLAIVALIDPGAAPPLDTAARVVALTTPVRLEDLSAAIRAAVRVGIA